MGRFMRLISWSRYAFDQATGTIKIHSEALVTPLGGARHLTMSADEKFVYVNEEAGGCVASAHKQSAVAFCSPRGIF